MNAFAKQNERNERAKQGRDKQGPKRRYTANTKHHASINPIRKAIYYTQRYRNDPLNNVVNLSKRHPRIVNSNYLTRT